MGSTFSAAASTGLSAEERLEAIRQFSDEYFLYLTTTGGVVLTAEFRVQVAKWTIEALSCKGCANLPKDSCLHPDANVYEAIQELDHGRSQGKDAVVVHIIHSMVHHQGRLDQVWYDTTMKNLEKAEFLDASMNERDPIEKKYLLNCLFSELMAVVSTTQGLHMVKVVLKEPAPQIPNVSSTATPPNLLDWTQILLPGKTAHEDSSRAWMPFLVGSDIDNDHDLLKDLIPNADSRKALLRSMIPQPPFSCMTWSPLDFLWILRLSDTLYIDEGDFRSPFRPLPPSLGVLIRLHVGS